MIILAAALSLALGIFLGYSFCAWVQGRVFQALVDQGIIVIKTDDGWQGTPAAILSLAAWMKAVNK